MSRSTHVQNLQYIQSIISTAAAAAPVARTDPCYDFYSSSQTGQVLFPSTSVRNSLCTLRPSESHYRPFQQQDFQSDQPADQFLWLLPEQRPELTLVHPSIPKRRRTSLAPPPQFSDGFHPLLCSLPRAHTSYTRDQRFLCGRSQASSTSVNRTPGVQFVHSNGRAGRRMSYLHNSGGLRHSYMSSSSSSTPGLPSSEVFPPSSANFGSTSGRGCSYGYSIHVPNRRKRHCFTRRFKCQPYINPTEFPYPNVNREDSDSSVTRLREPQLRGYKNASVSNRQQIPCPPLRNSQPMPFLDASEHDQINASLTEQTSRLTDVMTTLSSGAQSICNGMLSAQSMHDIFEATDCERTVVSSPTSAMIGTSQAPTLSTMSYQNFRNAASTKQTTNQSRRTGSLSSRTQVNEHVPRSSNFVPFSEQTNSTITSGCLNFDGTFPSRLAGPQTNSSEAVVAAVASAAQAVANAVSAVVSHHRHLSNGVYGIGEPLVLTPLESDVFPAPHEQSRFTPTLTEHEPQVSTESRRVLPNVSDERADTVDIGRWISAHSLPACFSAPHDSNLPLTDCSIPGHTAMQTLANQSVFGSISTSTTEAIQAPVPVVAAADVVRCPNPCCSLPTRSVCPSSFHSVSCCSPYRTIPSIPENCPPSPAPFTLVPSAFPAVDILTASNSYAAVTSPSFAFPTAPNMSLNFSAVPRPSQTNYMPISAQMAGALNLTPIPQLAPVRLGTSENTVMRNLAQPSLGHPPTLRRFLGPQLSFCTQLSPVSILPVQNFPVTSYTDTLSATRDAQTLFQFLRLMNQRQEPYSLPYYPSAMTATAGGSNVSVVVSASLGGTNGSRVAAAVTPPLTPHHSVFPPHPQATLISHNQLPPPFSVPSGLLTHSTRGLSPPTTSVQPVSSAAMALAAVAVAAAAALHQQQNMRHFSATAFSALTNPPAAPTPSIPVPILHAQLYYPATVPVSHVSSPCYHSHYGSHSASQPHISVVSQDVLTTPAAASSSAYWTQLVPLLLALPSTSTSADQPMQAPYAAAHAMPVGNAFAAVAAAAAAAAASVDTLYQLAVHLESGSGSLNRGLSTEELTSLPVRIYQTKPDSSNLFGENTDPTGDRCMICLDDYADADKLRQMRCRHEFHVDCVDKWLKTKRTCPLCRADAFDGSQRKDEFL